MTIDEIDVLIILECKDTYVNEERSNAEGLWLAEPDASKDSFDVLVTLIVTGRPRTKFLFNVAAIKNCHYYYITKCTFPLIKLYGFSKYFDEVFACCVIEWKYAHNIFMDIC